MTIPLNVEIRDDAVQDVRVNDRRNGRLARRYFAFAHVALACAGLLLLLEPQHYVGFFYHPRMMAVVHLVTLGWLSASILGGLYWVLPLALRARLVAGRADAVAFWSFVIGVTGMVSHFWLDTYSGMVWSALLAAASLAFVAVRAARAVARARVALGVKLHVVFAASNIVLAAGLGIAVGLARQRALLPASTLDNVFAHLHLGAVGWVTMMLFGIASRLLPMILASRVPSGAGPVASALLLEVGTLAIAARYVLSLPAWVRGAGAGLIAAAVVVFVFQLRWMLAHRVQGNRVPGNGARPHRAAAGLARWPIAAWHGGQALLFLGLSVGLGLVLAGGWADPVAALRWAPVYGVCGLLGFLGRAVAGFGIYLLPVAARVEATGVEATIDRPTLPPPPERWTRVGPRRLAFFSWSLAVPVLVVGQLVEHAAWMRLGGGLLLVAALFGLLSHGRALRHHGR